jgi:hypothetical protein
MRLLIIGEYTIELMDTDLVSVTKSIYDVENPEQRKSSFTKTITLPASRVNNQVFSAYFEVGMTIESNSQFNPYYNPTKKVKAQYYEDTICIIDGYAQLTDIVKVDELITYNITIYGENAELFKRIEGKKISDLDLSIFDHTYNKTNIEFTWTATRGQGYVYPMVKNGKQSDIVVSGVTYKDYWKVADFDLWFYCKTLWDLIFIDAECNYYSNFINSSLFAKLILKGDANGMVRTEAEINESLVSYDLATSGLRAWNSNNNFNYFYNNTPIIFDTLLQDNLDQYSDLVPGNLIVDKTADYDFKLECSPIFKNVSGSTLPVGFKCVVKFLIIDDLYNVVFSKDFERVLTTTLADNASIQWGAFAEMINLRLDATRTYRLCTGFVFFGTEVSIDSAQFNLYLNSKFDNGDVISVNSLLNKDLTQKDFIMGIVNMFNLYIEPYYYNPLDNNSGGYMTYLVEPRDDYYTDDIIDWTPKLDRNKEFKITPLAGSKERFINFTYLEDKDYYNNLYTQMTGRLYGDFKATIDNDFLSGTKEVKIPFSLIITAKNSDPIQEQIRPMAYDVDSKDFTGVRTDKSKPKIAFMQDFKACDTYYFGDDIAGNNITIPQMGMVAIPAYATCGTLDDTIAPTTDLVFQVPEKVFYTFEDGTFHNDFSTTLFWKYHFRQTYELNNKNSKMIECYMNLTSLDMLNLSLRPIYEINGYQYRLYEVVDYNGFDTTLCRFLKIQGVAVPQNNDPTFTRGGRRSGTNKNPDIYFEDGNMNDRLQNGGLPVISSVLKGGVNLIPIIDENVVSLAYNTIKTENDLVLNGNEGSPFYIICENTTTQFVQLPNEDINEGKEYVVHNSITSIEFVAIKDFGGSTISVVGTGITQRITIVQGTILIN